MFSALLEGWCTPFVFSDLISGFRAEQAFSYKPREQCFLPALRHCPVPRSVWKLTVVASFYHLQRETCIWRGGQGVSHLTSITYLLWAEMAAPKIYIPSCCPHWELRWVVTCQRNPFVLRTGYGKEKKDVFLRTAALMSSQGNKHLFKMGGIKFLESLVSLAIQNFHQLSPHQSLSLRDVRESFTTKLCGRRTELT